VLGIGSKLPILEAIAEMPAEQAREKTQLLDEMERETASRSTAMPGAVELLEALHRRGTRLGILTRNSHANAVTTLAACGFAHYFADDDILHRESCAPKPEPDGVELLLRQWNSERQDTVMVGDYLFDLQAGNNAGTATIYIDCSGQFEWAALADISVASFKSLLPLPKSTVC
jgi:HAD superfamily hydrolase (TIGR01509 family)